MAINIVKIFPPIGIARLGNSPPDWPPSHEDKGEWFIGPEIPGNYIPSLPWDGHYKDSKFRIKRQAARFRIFGGATDVEAGSNNAKEITLTDADIKWTVKLANTKAAWNQFHQNDKGGVEYPNLPLRNPEVADRDSLRIRSGPFTLEGPNKVASFDTGTFLGKHVYLGEMRTDADGRLLVLGGLGNSEHVGIFGNDTIEDFADNDGWHDDVSDGPVNAYVRLKGTTEWIRASPAWVICAPPKFAPQIQHIITLYDTLLQVAVDRQLLVLPTRPLSFTKDIYPLLARAMNMKWVSSLADTMHGYIHGVMPVPNSTGPAGSPEERQAIFGRLRDPNTPSDTSVSQQDMPKIWSDFYPRVVSEALKKIQYQTLQRWRDWLDDNDIHNDWIGHPVPEIRITPDGLTRAALESCVGGAFYPGIETSFMIRDTYTFMEPFRLDPTPLHKDPLLPGDLTKQMAVPWQADFFNCRYDREEPPFQWWPAARPDDVFLFTGSQKEWARDVSSEDEMVQKWHKLGFVVQKPDTDPPQYFETERHD